MRIGLFDSGIGGLTLLQRAREYLPQEEFIFYADTDHVPYGEKTKEEIINYSRRAVQFLADKGCDAIVIACNTATSVAAAILRQEINVPIIGIEPAVKPAIACSHHKRILVMATEVTVREKKLKELVNRVDAEHLVDMISMPEFVRFAENGIFEGDEVEQYLKQRLEGFQISDYSVIVLGCTHFNHFKKPLQFMFGGGCQIIDGSEGTVRNLVHILEEKNLPSAGKQSIEYYQSGKMVTNTETLAFYEMLMNRLQESE